MPDQPKNPNKTNVSELDPNMALEKNELAGLQWLSPAEKPFRLSGFSWFEQDRIFRRLPVHSEHPIPSGVNVLANHTAGGQLAFQTDSRQLAIRVQLAHKADMYHMPATGQCGFDLYLGKPGEQAYYKTSRFDHTNQAFEVLLYDFPVAEMRHVTLNFPLYQGVNELAIGVDADALIEAPLPYHNDKKVIIYGTSITQGGCASRPGMAYTNILSRRIPLEFINLGFSGNGRGEPEMARIISEIDNPAMLVLDYEANAVSPELLKQTLPEFIRILREAHPIVPILVISKFEFSGEPFEPDLRNKRLEMTRIERETVEQLRGQGDENIHFYDGSQMMGTDDTRFECTVDGVHPTDLGFMRMADKLTPVFRELLQRELD
ncbi:SGNH/GDSL hydrolase family protein [Paenibacillus sp. GCM10027626]|uniref:SGNH/GDSL hydrolase family protein n=1 Tax=Paenibacillus sp. GCM10027626 TaxID=3273411 RepID=UPI00363C73E0